MPTVRSLDNSVDVPTVRSAASSLLNQWSPLVERAMLVNDHESRTSRKNKVSNEVAEERISQASELDKWVPVDAIRVRDVVRVDRAFNNVRKGTTNPKIIPPNLPYENCSHFWDIF